jgi:hypothetical protein
MPDSVETPKVQRVELAVTALPGEQIVVEALKFATEVVRKQPPEIAAKYWDTFWNDYERWRKFWAKLLPGVFE